MESAAADCDVLVVLLVSGVAVVAGAFVAAGIELCDDEDAVALVVGDCAGCAVLIIFAVVFAAALEVDAFVDGAETFLATVAFDEVAFNAAERVEGNCGCDALLLDGASSYSDSSLVSGSCLRLLLALAGSDLTWMSGACRGRILWIAVAAGVSPFASLASSLTLRRSLRNVNIVFVTLLLARIS